MIKKFDFIDIIKINVSIYYYLTRNKKNKLFSLIINKIYDILINFSRLYYNCNEIIVYRLISYIYAISKSNIRDVINYIYRKTLKLIMLKLLFLKRSLINFL